MGSSSWATIAAGGSVTSITPGVGFTSAVPITAAGTLDIDGTEVALLDGGGKIALAVLPAGIDPGLLSIAVGDLTLRN